MTYTITVKPSQTPGKVTATSTNGHSLTTTTTPLLDSARYWLQAGAPSSASIVTVWSSGSTAWALRSTIGHAASLVVMGDRFQKAKKGHSAEQLHGPAVQRPSFGATPRNRVRTLQMCISLCDHPTARSYWRCLQIRVPFLGKAN